MYVVRRPFRHNNRMLLPGTRVVPGEVKRFKQRIKDRQIVEVNEQNFNDWEFYFNCKYNTSMLALNGLSNEETEAEETEAEETEAEETEDKPKKRVVVAAVTK